MHRILSALALLTFVLWTSPALAHSKMATSVPSDGASVAKGLSKIDLKFTKPVRLTLVKVTQTETQTDVKSEVLGASGLSKSQEVSVSPLNPGKHTLAWTAIGEDGHVMKGSFSFKVTDQ
ncbi:MAG: copper resistance protein CopC [Hyphomicrobiaceae bacterium]